MMWLKKIYWQWKKDKRPWIYTTRTAVEINEALITSIADTVLNKFTDDNVKLKYNKGSFKDGIVDVFIDDEIFFRIVSLSIPLRRIKLAVLKRIKGVLTDEYIINPKTNEKYIKNEAFIIKEAYTTWRREAEGMLKWYFLANPYSLFNPIFLDWGVPVVELKKDSFYIGDYYIIHWAVLNPLLKEKILKENPLYVFDDEYNDYALEGTAINDANIPLNNLPRGFRLKHIFKLGEYYVGCYVNTNYSDTRYRYHCKMVEDVSIRRTVYCFDLDELVNRTVVMDAEDRFNVASFKDALRTNRCKFEDVNCYYIIKEVFKSI